jgi:isoleucyl-tRNA synthetase
MFRAVSPKVNFPEIEEAILTYWKENKIFEKSIELRPEDKPWAFVDGPPFVTGLPHYGSLLSSLPRDLFGRYYTMKGYRVRRLWGWDGHGLPIENKVEGELGVTRKRDIEEKIGIEKFIERCLHYVNQVSDEWEWYVDHIGRWVDFKNAYKTWDVPYMESVMWVFKQMYEKGYIYKGLRVSLYCPHCSTPISNFEVAMDAENYKELVDAATIYKYPLEDEDKTYILAWSTTPWNKIVTPALAVNPELVYITVEQNGEKYILAEATKKILGDESTYTILEQYKGTELLGKKYVPHYDYYTISEGKKAFEIVGGDFVTAEEGSGVVTIAAYGEEDLKLMKELNIHIEMHLDEEGTIKESVPKFGGMYYLKANKAVNQDLAERGLIYKDEDLPHNVPLCWRCHTRLYYSPQDAWYVDVQSLKPQMKETNELVSWYPAHFKQGRFAKSIEAAPDWCISRSRYWGSPVPVWECECGERFVPGSIAELEQASGQKITNLHKPEIDLVTTACVKCKKTTKRVPEVLDSWIEAGSATLAERHFPFEGETDPATFLPPDFIAEYTGQIRAWFYVMHVIANALELREDGLNILAKNVLVEGVILGTDGRKMSKNFKNYPDPKEMLSKYGGDALRLYLMGSPVMNGEDMIISEENYRNQVRGMMLVLWNSYNFFITYANLDSWSPSTVNREPITVNILDQWILSRLQGLVRDVTVSLDGYNTVDSIDHIQKFVNELSTWYIRRSRDRVGAGAENQKDSEAFYTTTYTVLKTLVVLLAPITPFLSEEIYRNLTGEESVHLADWPEFDNSMINESLEKEMVAAQEVASQILMMRKTHQVAVKMPLKIISYSGPQQLSGLIIKIVAAEVNAYELVYEKESESWSCSDEKEFIDEHNQDIVAGKMRDIIRKIQQQRKILGTTFDEKVDVQISEWPEEYTEAIKKQALVDSLVVGSEFVVTRKNV